MPVPQLCCHSTQYIAENRTPHRYAAADTVSNDKLYEADYHICCQSLVEDLTCAVRPTALLKGQTICGSHTMSLSDALRSLAVTNKGRSNDDSILNARAILTGKGR